MVMLSSLEAAELDAANAKKTQKNKEHFSLFIGSLHLPYELFRLSLQSNRRMTSEKLLGGETLIATRFFLVAVCADPGHRRSCAICGVRHHAKRAGASSSIRRGRQSKIKI
jgi:hypothetical protein